MIAYIIIAIISLLASLLTFFAGFGLGTILLPVIAIFFPIPIAVAITAFVHLFNNIFKLSMLYKSIDKKTVIRFGILSIIGAFLGAYSLNHLPNYPIHFQYFNTTIQKIVFGSILIFFAFFEVVPILKNFKFNEKFLGFGGLLSGYMGGLSGHQGALRSAFLINLNLSKEAYVATGTAIACLVDFTRIPFYFANNYFSTVQSEYKLIIVVTLAAFAGAYFGNFLFKKITIDWVQYIVFGLLLIFGVLLFFGII